MTKKKLTTDTQRVLAEFRRNAEPIMARIAKDRDALRALVSDIEQVLESVEGAIENFDMARDHLDRGLDRLSEYL